MLVKAAQQARKGTAIKATDREQSLPSARMSERRDPAALLLRFQRAHGNRFVQRTSNLARKAERELENRLCQ
jgi:hypothetical protein